MTKETFKQQLRQYAIDELKTVGGIEHPTLSQIKAKEQEMLSWSIIQAVAKQVQVAC